MGFRMEYGDTNFIALVNADQYKTYVSEDGELDMLLNHFVQEMQIGNILVLQMTNEGVEHSWTTEFTFENNIDVESCYRRAKGYIQVTDNQLYLVDYTCLTMAAQFEDCIVPDDNCARYRIELQNGTYQVEIIQYYNPDIGEYVGIKEAELIMDFKKVTELGKNEDKVIWCSYM
ncbi:hypothetical protein MHB43_08270 [Paenibacillus sp. FSL H8-0317]|uniref:hypothetical protein n=1 Tax=Paenibacillus sp. FSL H8-0317 TaxID=2921385 RepID=UPI00324CCAA1